MKILILEILKCIPAVKISVFLDLGKNISFSDNLLGLTGYELRVGGWPPVSLFGSDSKPNQILLFDTHINVTYTLNIIR
jgi:hypothetical protein